MNKLHAYKAALGASKKEAHKLRTHGPLSQVRDMSESKRSEPFHAYLNKFLR